MSLKIDHSTNKIGVQGQTLFTLPSTDGVSGQALVTNGTATLSFANTGKVSVGDNAPTSPSPVNGDLWYNSANGRLYVYYTDANTSQWVDASPDASGVANIRCIDDISSQFNGATTAFTLNVGGLGVSPASPQQLIIVVGGVLQTPTSGYTVSGSTITFTSAPPSGTSFSGVLLGAATTLNTVADDTISTTKIQAGAVTASKLTIDGDIIPTADNTYDLGSESFRFANVFTGDLNLSNEGSANDVDGTWGSYTMQEGEDALFLINRRTGKRYKFVLEEV